MGIPPCDDDDIYNSVLLGLFSFKSTDSYIVAFGLLNNVKS